jgi:hypothetical protein
MIKTLSKILLVFISLLTISCSVIVEPMPKSWDWGLKPRPLTGVKNFPESNTDYGHGFKDGCEGIWTVVGKGGVDLVKPKLNPVLMSKNPDYANGWYDGMEQCVYIIDHDVL